MTQKSKDEYFYGLISRSDLQQIPLIKLIPQILMFATYFLILSLLGLRGFESLAGVEKCSATYWALFVFLFFYTVSINLLLKKYYLYE